MILTRHDAPLLKPMLDATAARVVVMDQVVKHKGFDGGLQRRAGRDHGAGPVIPLVAPGWPPGATSGSGCSWGCLHLVLRFIRLRSITNVTTA